MEEEIEKHKKYSLSDSEVMALVNGKAKVVMYDQLNSFKNIDELLSPYGSVFILYQKQKNFGHWCCLFKRRDKHGNVEIEYFEPYGHFIDEPLTWTSKESRKALNMDYPYLTKLLLESPRNYNIIYNEHPFQKMGKNINTCGRHCVMRLQHKNKSLNEYVKLFGNVNSKKTDDIVTAETMFDI